MSTAANPLSRASNSVLPIVIKENSTFLKAISCVPVVGIVVSLFQEISLGRKITETKDPAKLIELMELKNQYKFANAVRNLLTSVLIVAGIAFGYLNGTFAVSAGLYIVFAGLHIYRINQNNQLINELRSTGFRPGIQFV